MKSFISKKKIVKAVSMLFILIFVYASITKLRNIKNFQFQIGQSAVLGVFAEWISFGVIGAELLTAGFLSFGHTQRVGLYLSCILMTLFTIYIILVLNFSKDIPCPCGGIISAMGWNTHVIFNISCIALAIIALFKKKENDLNQNKELRRQEKPKT
ncbi:hypothetical protein M0G43_11895 [Subsaxibacter sp. CAU 1640]|uniref:MauE/DoxX family redox-associated membrane protein n=1 Tax=Subsaxibacter sp. CAU 1640 TaxID=2933271 RepID=UPI002003FFDD|nr:MauE/DoxX family redox-associated membrane protein [Subsaxibacter sp. CAU 1640]MCK7591279.1 hypothetical protein [Subsaxibacter sp. CAU 1640]